MCSLNRPSTRVGRDTETRNEQYLVKYPVYERIFFCWSANFFSAGSFNGAFLVKVKSKVVRIWPETFCSRLTIFAISWHHTMQTWYISFTWIFQTWLVHCVLSSFWKWEWVVSNVEASALMPRRKKCLSGGWHSPIWSIRGDAHLLSGGRYP